MLEQLSGHAKTACPPRRAFFLRRGAAWCVARVDRRQVGHVDDYGMPPSKSRCGAAKSFGRKWPRPVAAAAKIAALPVAGEFLWANRPSCRSLAVTIRDAVKTKNDVSGGGARQPGGAVHERSACGASRQRPVVRPTQEADRLGGEIAA